MVNHLAALPPPEKTAKLSAALKDISLPPLSPEQSHYQLHLIYEDCSCTKGLLRHLWKRQSHPEVFEKLIFMGRATEVEKQSLQAGYEVEVIGKNELLETFGIRGAPILVIMNGEREILYMGGYFQYPSATISKDVELLELAQQGLNPDPLPLYGCAIDPKLQEELDPIGIIY